MDMRPAFNLLVLKGTAFRGRNRWLRRWTPKNSREVAGTVAGDDTVVVITAVAESPRGRPKRMEDLLR